MSDSIHCKDNLCTRLEVQQDRSIQFLAIAFGDSIPEALAKHSTIFRGFAFEQEPCGPRYYIPYWLLVMTFMASGIASVPWLPYAAIQPPHSANRHDAGRRGAGVGGLLDERIIHKDASNGQ